MTFGRAVLLDWCKYKDRNRDCLTQELGHILYCYMKGMRSCRFFKKIRFQDGMYDIL